MSTKHTPEPWYVSQINQLTVMTSSGIICLEAGRTLAASNVDEAKANIRLAAAAPDLRAACELCERTITELVEVEQPTSTDWVNIRAARTHARAAIAKAEPEEP